MSSIKKIFFIVSIFGISLFSNAQQISLQGMVKVNNSITNTTEAKYVEGVEIQYFWKNSNNEIIKFSDRSGSDGKFRLDITGVTGNPQISLNVVFDKKNEDYYVVNKDVISDITLKRDSPIEILVFSKKEAERLKQQAIDKILQPEREKLAEMLDRQNKEQQENIRLRDSIFAQDKIIDEQTKTINNSLDYWLQLDLDKNDKNYTQAYELTKQGKLEEALKFIPNEDINLINTKLEQINKTTRLRIEIFKMMGDSINIKKEYNSIIEKSKDNDEVGQAQRELEAYLQQIGDFRGAKEVNIGRKKSNFEKSTKTKIEEINRLNSEYKNDKNLGNKNAYKHLINAIELYKQIQENIFAKKEAAISYTLLANYYYSKKRYQFAENNYLKALDIYILLRKNGIQNNENYLNLMFDILIYSINIGKKNIVEDCRNRIKLLKEEMPLTEEQKINITLRETETQISFQYSHYYYRYSDLNKVIDYYHKKDSTLYKRTIIKYSLRQSLLLNIENNELGKKFIKSKKDSLIIKHCNFALNKINEKSDSLKYQTEKCIAYVLKANAHKHLKEEDESKYYFDRAKQMATELQNDDLLEFYKQVKHENWQKFKEEWGSLFIMWGGTLLLMIPVEFGLVFL